jgi:hypothetical protein
MNRHNRDASINRKVDFLATVFRLDRMTGEKIDNELRAFNRVG